MTVDLLRVCTADPEPVVPARAPLDMTLLDLPPELLEKIVKLLNTASRLALWSACGALRAAVRSRRVMHHMFLTGFTEEVLQSPSVVDLAQFAGSLNLKEFRHLSPTKFMQGLPNFINLTSLNVTRTQIPMWQVGEACELCLQLISLKTQFDWPNYGNPDESSRLLVERCQHSFSRLQEVCFHSSSQEIIKCGHVLQLFQKSNKIEILNIKLFINEETFTSFYHFDCMQPIPPSLHTFSIVISGNISLSPYSEGLLLNVFRNSKSWQHLIMDKSGDGFKFEMTEKLMERVREFPDFLDSITLSKDGLRDLQPIREFKAWHSNLEEHGDCYKPVIAMLHTYIPIKVCKMKANWRKSEKSYCVSPCVLPLHVGSAEEETFHSGVQLDIGDIVGHVYNLKLKIERWCDCFKHTISREHPRIYYDANLRSLNWIHNLEICCCAVDSSFADIFKVCKQLKTLKLVNRNILLCGLDCGYLSVIKNIRFSQSLKYLTLNDINLTMQTVLECIQSPVLKGIQICARADEEINKQVYKRFIQNCPGLRYCYLYFFLPKNNEHFSLKRYMQRCILLTARYVDVIFR